MESKKEKNTNKKIVLIVIGVIILGLILYIFYPYGTFVKDKKITEISYFEYHFNPGWGKSKTYIINCSNKNTCIANIKVDYEEHNDITVNEKDMTRFINMLNKYHVGSWDGFDKRKEGWYDLNRFSLNISIQSNEKIKAKGYGYFPRNYEKLSQDLDSLFLDLI